MQDRLRDSNAVAFQALPQFDAGDSDHQQKEREMRYEKPKLHLLDSADRSIHDLFTKADGGVDGIGGWYGQYAAQPGLRS